MRNIIKLACILLVISTSVNAQKTKLQLKLKKGDIYTQQVEMNNTMNQKMMGQNITIDQNMTMISSLEVVDVLSSGNFILEQSYNQIKMDMNANGQNMTFDTENSDTSTPALAPLAKMKEAKIKFEVSPSGDISNISGLNEMVSSISSNNPQTAGMIKNMASESTLSSTFAYLPKEKISKGDSYTNSITLKEMFGMEIVSKYTVASVSGKTIDLNLFSDISFAPKEPIAQNGINMNIKATGNQNGTFSINKSDGMATASEMSQVMDMTMSMKNPQNGQDMMIPMKVKTIVKSTVSKN